MWKLLTNVSDMCAEYAEAEAVGGDGLVVWGPSEATKTAAGCETMRDAMRSIGPFLRNVTRSEAAC